ncbi:hypothetical protein AKO1_006283 [Acrasis kona]|uniref:ATP synthase subunit e, mitochondrial n=1 Tax=Acrasis kona TaxID=1008807 RepID=A0AAW2YI84_9EUKA
MTLGSRVIDVIWKGSVVGMIGASGYAFYFAGKRGLDLILEWEEIKQYRTLREKLAVEILSEQEDGDQELERILGIPEAERLPPKNMLGGNFQANNLLDEKIQHDAAEKLINENIQDKL